MASFHALLRDISPDVAVLLAQACTDYATGIVWQQSSKAALCPFISQIWVVFFFFGGGGGWLSRWRLTTWPAKLHTHTHTHTQKKKKKRMWKFFFTAAFNYYCLKLVWQLAKAPRNSKSRTRYIGVLFWCSTSSELPVEHSRGEEHTSTLILLSEVFLSFLDHPLELAEEASGESQTCWVLSSAVSDFLGVWREFTQVLCLSFFIFCRRSPCPCHELQQKEMSMCIYVVNWLGKIFWSSHQEALPKAVAVYWSPIGAWTYNIIQNSM